MRSVGWVELRGEEPGGLKCFCLEVEGWQPRKFFAHTKIASYFLCVFTWWVKITPFPYVEIFLDADLFIITRFNIEANFG